MKQKTIYAIGDSHARPFAHHDVVEGVLDYEFEVFALGIGMASARGLVRDKNTTNSREKIERGFVKIGRPIDVLCFNFGQVDMEYVYPYRTYVKNIDQHYTDFAADTIELYMQGIESFARRAPKVVVKGINYPVIFERKSAIENTIRQLRVKEISDISKDEVNEISRRITKEFPPYPQRRKRAIVFNKYLKKECEKRGFGYFDVLDDIIDHDTRRVRLELLPYGRLEHHLANNVLTQKIYLDSLQTTISET